jgi:hypothetical protein
VDPPPRVTRARTKAHNSAASKPAAAAASKPAAPSKAAPSKAKPAVKVFDAVEVTPPAHKKSKTALAAEGSKRTSAASGTSRRTAQAQAQPPTPVVAAPVVAAPAGFAPAAPGAAPNPLANLTQAQVQALFTLFGGGMPPLAPGA